MLLKKFRLLEGLFLGVTWVCLRFVIVVIPDHTHYFGPFLGFKNFELVVLLMREISLKVICEKSQIFKL